MLDHFHILHFALSRELEELYATHIVRAFGFALIAVFVPVYLLQLGHSVTTVILFYIVVYLSHMAVTWIAPLLISRIGTKHTIALSMPFVITFYLLMLALETRAIPVLAIAPFFGVQNALYWISYHTDFAYSTKKKGRGEAVGISEALPRIAAIVGPVAGAFVISMVSFQALFGAAAVVFVVAAVPLFMTSDARHKPKTGIRHVFRERSARESLSLVVIGMKFIGEVLFWPLSIFLVLGSVVSLGEAMSAALLFTAILNLVTGRLSDKHGTKVLVRAGGILDSATYAVKAFASNVFSILGISALGGMTNAMSMVLHHKKVYDRSRKSDVISYIVYRETLLIVGGIIAMSVAILLLASNVQLALLLSALGALGLIIF